MVGGAEMVGLWGRSPDSFIEMEPSSKQLSN